MRLSQSPLMLWHLPEAECPSLHECHRPGASRGEVGCCSRSSICQAAWPASRDGALLVKAVSLVCC
jgi:hypothetical protein